LIPRTPAPHTPHHTHTLAHTQTYLPRCSTHSTPPRHTHIQSPTTTSNTTQQLYSSLSTTPHARPSADHHALRGPTPDCTQTQCQTASAHSRDHGPSVCPSMCPCARLFAYVSVCLSVRLSVCLSVCLSVSVGLSIRHLVRLCACPRFCLSVCVPAGVFHSIRVSVRQAVSRAVGSSVRLCVCPSANLSINRSYGRTHRPLGVVGYTRAVWHSTSVAADSVGLAASKAAQRAIPGQAGQDTRRGECAFRSRYTSMRWCD
jgi:hypothetical protein